ncbi:MAG: hypothetical protein AB7L65_03470 [Hyphomonadaceae bacterium]
MHDSHSAARARSGAGAKRAAKRLGALGIWLACAPAAFAGAWIAPEGGQSIQTDAIGAREDGAAYVETQYYWERPLTPRRALIIRPWLQTEKSARETLTRGEVQIAAKAIVAQTRRTVTAVQASALWRSDPAPGCSEGGGEARMLGGLSSEDGRAFANAEIGARFAAGGCTDGRFDLTLGYRPGGRWLALAETFTDQPYEGAASVKAQLSLVRYLRSGAGVQFGARVRVDGGGEEGALVLAFWGAPRR